MKLNKMFVCLICLFLSFSAVSARDVEYLYVIKNIPQENIVNVINNYFSQTDYQVVSRNDFYILPPKTNKNSDYYEVLLKQNGSDCYLYYFSNNDLNNLNELLQKEIKKGHLNIKIIEAPEISNAFKEKVASLKKNSENSLLQAQNYDFSDNAELTFEQKNNIPIVLKQVKPNNFINVNTNVAINKNSKKNSDANYIPLRSIQTQKHLSVESSAPISSKNTLKGAVVTIASGTVINASLQSGISSASMAQSDKITAVLNTDFKQNGLLIFPTGTIIYGSAIKANSATYGYGNGSLDLIFNQALLPNGNKINISVDKISYAKNSTRAINITKDVAIGTGLGVLGGLLSAAYTGDYQQALLVGASIGAAGGGIHAATCKGDEIEIPEGTVLNLRINQAINISPYN